MDNAFYVFAAYAVIWLLSLGYIFSIAHRQQSLRKEIEALKDAIPEEGYGGLRKTAETQT